MPACVVIALAGHAYAQPSEPPPPDTSGPIYDPNAPPLPPADPAPPPPAPVPPPQAYSPPQPYPPPYAVAPQPPPEKKAESARHTLCFFGRPFECASVLLLEVGARGDKTRTVTSANLGLLIHNRYDAYGATIGGLGIEGGDAKDDASLWYAARYRRYLGTWGFAADVSVGYANGAAFEVAIGWGDVIALTGGVNQYETTDGEQDFVATAGFRVGSVTIGGLFYFTILALASAR